MPAVPITPTTRYFPPGTRKLNWLIACANPAAPTRAEINAGSDLSAEIETVNGWSLGGSTVDVPDMGSRFTATVPGRLTSPSNDLTIYNSQNSIDARTLLPRDTNGFMLCFWEGDVAGQKVDVFPARVITQAVDTTVDDPGKTTYSFAITKLPSINVTVPA